MYLIKYRKIELLIFAAPTTNRYRYQYPMFDSGQASTHTKKKDTQEGQAGTKHGTQSPQTRAYIHTPHRHHVKHDPYEYRALAVRPNKTTQVRTSNPHGRLPVFMYGTRYVFPAAGEWPAEHSLPGSFNCCEHWCTRRRVCAARMARHPSLSVPEKHASPAPSSTATTFIDGCCCCSDSVR